MILGPSGVGKGTVIQLLKARYADIFVFPISATTRAPRPGEKDGETYYYISEKDFDAKERAGEFLEWAYVHGKKYRYGTLKEPIFSALNAGKNVVRELDIQGFESINDMLAFDEFVSIFLEPPSLEILRRRIEERSPLSAEEIEKRMASAEYEMAQRHRCHYQVPTKDGDVMGTFADVEKIILQELGEDRSEKVLC